MFLAVGGGHQVELGTKVHWESMLFLFTCKQDVSLASHVFDIGPVQILKSPEPCADTKILQILVCLYIYYL